MSQNLNIKKLGPSQYRLIIRVKIFGKDIKKRISFKGSLKEAQNLFIQKRNQIEKEVRDNYSIEFKNFNQVLDLYIEKIGSIPKKDDYRFVMLRTSLGDERLSDFANKFEKFLSLYRKTPLKLTGNPPSNSTINQYITITKAAFNVALVREKVKKNPITSYRFPKLSTIPRDRVLSTEEVKRLLASIQKHNPHLLGIVKFSLQVPCRKNELINMRIGDLDLINECILVKSKYTKTKKPVWKPIPKNMLSYFRTIPNTSEYLFYRYDELTKKYVGLGDFKNAWKKVLMKAGIDDFRFHDTRHHSVSALIDSGNVREQVISIAGWATDMLKTYYHDSGKEHFNRIKWPALGNVVSI